MGKLNAVSAGIAAVFSSIEMLGKQRFLCSVTRQRQLDCILLHETVKLITVHTPSDTKTVGVIEVGESLEEAFVVRQISDLFAFSYLLHQIDTTGSKRMLSILR